MFGRLNLKVHCTRLVDMISMHQRLFAVQSGLVSKSVLLDESTFMKDPKARICVIRNLASRQTVGCEGLVAEVMGFWSFEGSPRDGRDLLDDEDE